MAYGWAKFVGQSEAMQTYSGEGHQKHYMKQKEEKIRVKDY